MKFKNKEAFFYYIKRRLSFFSKKIKSLSSKVDKIESGLGGSPGNESVGGRALERSGRVYFNSSFDKWKSFDTITTGPLSGNSQDVAPNNNGDPSISTFQIGRWLKKGETIKDLLLYGRVTGGVDPNNGGDVKNIMVRVYIKIDKNPTDTSIGLINHTKIYEGLFFEDKGDVSPPGVNRSTIHDIDFTATDDCQVMILYKRSFFGIPFQLSNLTFTFYSKLTIK